MNAHLNPEWITQVFNLTERIAAQENTADLTVTMWELNELLGLTGSVFVSFAREAELRDSYRFINACPAAWCQEYNASAWYMIDPCLLYSLTHSEPAPIEDIPVKSRGQRNMMEAARRCGFVSGWVIPSHSPSGRSRMGVLYLGSDDPQHFGKTAIKQVRPILRAISGELLDWFTRQVRQELMSGGDLSTDEKEMLLMTFKGAGSKEIANHLQMTKSAVDQRLHRLSSRFDSSSRREAAQLAYEFGLLT